MDKIDAMLNFYERVFRAGERSGVDVAISALRELFPNTIDDEAEAFVKDYLERIQQDA